jgi:putative membrane protein
MRGRETATLHGGAAFQAAHAQGVFDMKNILSLAAGGALVASVALAQTPPTATGAPSAQDFVNKVAISDMFEIQSSQLALSKQADADTKPFAEKMVQDHQKTSSELKAVVGGSMVKLTLPTAMDSEHQKMLDDLKAKSGNEFDQSYDQIQVKAHRDAVALFEAYGKGGDNAELKSWASKTLPHLKEHLSMAEKLK